MKGCKVKLMEDSNTLFIDNKQIQASFILKGRCLIIMANPSHTNCPSPLGANVESIVLSRTLALSVLCQVIKMIPL